MNAVTRSTYSEGATTTLNQVWFPGTHGCVGGGILDSSGLSDATLQWTIETIDKLSLGLDFVDRPEVVADGGIKPDRRTSFDPEIEGMFALGGISDRTLCSSKNDRQTFFDRNIHLMSHLVFQLYGKNVRVYLPMISLIHHLGDKWPYSQTRSRAIIL